MLLMVRARLHARDLSVEGTRLYAERLTAQGGCQQAGVQTHSGEHGLVRRAAWNQVHVDLLTQFYGRFHAALIAEGLRRTERAVYACAHRLGLEGGRGFAATEEARNRFWPAWRHAIRRNWDRWQAEELTDDALGLVLRPPAPFVPCDECVHRPGCRPMDWGPVPCERLTVGEYLRYYHAEEVT